MKLKQFFSIFFLLIFLAKPGIMDGKLYRILLSGEDVTFINKFCPKKQLQSKSLTGFVQATSDLQVQWDFLCHAPVVLESENWEWTIKEENFSKFIYQTPGLFSALRKKDDPPPRV